ncbi:MAG: glycosyltransferase family 1 protein [Patescibacteria group bacterium]|jgi:hypothetical protein
MRIGIDTRALETGHRFRGIGTYARNLLKNIARLDKENEYLFFTQKSPSDASQIVPQAFKYQDVLVRQTADPTRYNWSKDQYSLPRAIRKNKIDLVHFLDQLSCPMIKGAKTIVTVNDLFQLKGGQKNWKNSIKTWPLKRADKIIAISYYVKNDLIEFLKVDPGKIKIIYDGFDRDIFRLAEDPKKVEKFRQNLLKNRAKKYLFYIGSFIDHEPRKNLDFLLEIFEKFLKKSDENIKLVIVGKTGSESERLINLAKKTGVADKIIFTGYLEKDEELPLYFQAAEMLIFPSLLEGFGLPLLQAMACGTPVVSSNTSSLPEVMGEGGVLIDPQNINAWVEEIMRIVDEPEYRQKLIKQGLNQAEKFSWEKCARETLEIYKEVYQGETR